LFVKDKYVSEEIRNLVKEFNILMVTASQLNRAAVEEIEFDHSHISGGISKINTADNVFGIFTSRSMKERGQYQIQCMKTRSSSGVGQKVDLEFDLETLRISAPADDGTSNKFRPTPTSIMSQIKSKAASEDGEDGSTIRPTGTHAWDRPINGDQPKVAGNVNSNKLKSMLAGLKTSG